MFLKCQTILVSDGQSIAVMSLKPASATPTLSGVHDPLPGVLEVVARERLAVRPLQAVAQGPCDRHRIATVAGGLDPAVVDGRDLRREVGCVLVVLGEHDERGPGRGGDVGLGLLAQVERVELVGFLPVADDEGPAVRAVVRLVRSVEQVLAAGRNAGRRGLGRRRGCAARRRALRSVRCRARAARGHDDGRDAERGGESIPHWDLPHVPFRINPGPDRPVAAPRRSAGQSMSSMAARPTDADSRARAHRATEVRQASDVTLGPGRPTEKGHVRPIPAKRPERTASVRRTVGYPRAGRQDTRSSGEVPARARRERPVGRGVRPGRRPSAASRCSLDAARPSRCAAPATGRGVRIAARSSTGSWWP